MNDIKARIDQDLKQALLAGDKTLATTLRGIKSAILYVEVEKGSREQGLGDEEMVRILTKEAKKRQESAEMYQRGGNKEKAAAELEEKKVIERYLPAQMTEDEVATLVDEAISAQGAHGMEAMGQVIGAVKARIGASADGALIARLVKERLSQ